MSKVYEYEDKLYCEENLSKKYGNYGGDLFDMYLALKENREADETTVYYTEGSEAYDSPEELIENEFEDLIVEAGEQG